MFDEKTIGAMAPTNLPTEPDDMFAGVDKVVEPSFAPSAPNALQAGVLKKKDPDSAPSQSPFVSVPSSSVAMPTTGAQMYTVKEPIIGKVVIGVVLLVVLGVAGYFGYGLYAKGFFSSKSTDVIQPAIQPANNAPAPVVAPPVVPEAIVPETAPLGEAPEITPINTTTAEAPVNMANDEILFGEGTDTDKDGLDDVRENEIKTSPYRSDTDGDELSDGDEVIIWKTDPLNPDTDKDTYPDGREVKNGYNPLGPGKLFNVPTTTTK